MINLEVLRLELNYLKQVIKAVLGDKVSAEINEAITTMLNNIPTIRNFLEKVKLEMSIS